MIRPPDRILAVHSAPIRGRHHPRERHESPLHAKRSRYFVHVTIVPPWRQVASDRIHLVRHREPFVEELRHAAERGRIQVDRFVAVGGPDRVERGQVGIRPRVHVARTIVQREHMRGAQVLRCTESAA